MVKEYKMNESGVIANLQKCTYVVKTTTSEYAIIKSELLEKQGDILGYVDKPTMTLHMTLGYLTKALPLQVTLRFAMLDSNDIVFIETTSDLNYETAIDAFIEKSVPKGTVIMNGEQFFNYTNSFVL